MFPFRLFTQRIFCEVAHWLGASSLTWAQYIHNLVTGFTCFYIKLSISLKTSDFQDFFIFSLQNINSSTNGPLYVIPMTSLQDAKDMSSVTLQLLQRATQSRLHTKQMKAMRMTLRGNKNLSYILLMLLLVLFSKVSITLSDSYSKLQCSRLV